MGAVTKTTSEPFALQRETNSSSSTRNHKKTPLQQFDVAAFFEENLFDIIDLEENRSGVKEFEDAVKKEE